MRTRGLALALVAGVLLALLLVFLPVPPRASRRGESPRPSGSPLALAPVASGAATASRPERTPAADLPDATSPGATAPEGSASTGSIVRVTGTVVDRAGHGLPGATVHASASEWYTPGKTTAGTATTDGAGRYELELPAGRYVLEAQARGWAEKRDHYELHELAGPARTIPPLVLVPEGRVHGIVVDDRGAPVAAKLWLIEYPHRGVDPPPSSHVGASAADGTFRFEGVCDQGWACCLLVRADGYRPRDQQVQVAEGQDAEMRVVVARTAVLEVQVRGPAGSFPAEVHRGSEESPHRGYRMPDETDAAGHTRIESVAGDLEVFAVGANGLVGHTTARLVAGETRTAEVSLAPGLTISGRVLDRAGEPVAGEYVRAFGRRTWRLVRARQTDATGAFVLEGLLDEPQDVEVFQQPAVRVVPRAEGPTTIDLTLPGGAIEGRVLGVVGEPQQGTTVSLVDALGNAEERARTDDEGRFRIEHLAPGSYWVAAKGAGPRGGVCRFVDARRVAVGEDQPARVELALQEPAKVEGVVRGPDGQPLGRFHLRLTELGCVEKGGATGTFGAIPHGAITDEEGRFRFSDIFTGPAILQASPDALELVGRRVGRAVALAPVVLELESGKTASVDLRVAARDD